MWRSILLLVTVSLTTISALVSPTFETIQNAQVLNSKTGEPCSILPGGVDGKSSKSLVVLLPQLGEFDSSEFCEQLVAVQDDLTKAGIRLSVVGIGNQQCASAFSQFSGLPMEQLFVDPDASLHQQLKLNKGPDWDLPEGVSDGFLKFALNQLPGGAPTDESNNLRPAARAWLNYLAMCAGIGAPGTLPEILRGYFGDFSAPERFAEDDVVTAGFVTIGPGVGPVKLGPLKYSQWWQDERGYQRPVELATVRLKNMVEVLTKWDTYVSNSATIDQRGATYLLDNESGEVLYEYKHRGVLTYSETMPRPLTFLAPYIGEDIAKNPLGLLDYSDAKKQNSKGRGILKPAGKFMSLLGPLFALENKLQAKALGADGADLEAAKQEIQSTITENKVTVYTYGLSPFSSQTMALLKDAGCTSTNDVKQIEVGPEWFLLGKEASTTRAALLELTGQSSLPHVFINGQHIGGIFSGNPGLAALQETGKLQDMLRGDKKVLAEES
ncbi:unnamed protein product [Cylindrotheca closterium]|uniref:Glutaredoxin domain-containing protein n=1 Tax=Cylindrotheca closterium TaxID=2856 RepID=A0AAD2CVE4_9STRA|nr:unnamed protein product [Cylindrotheca closterium]